MIHHSRARWSAGGLSGTGGWLCEDTAIRSYSVRGSVLIRNLWQQRSRAHMLGVILPHQQSAWFFKLVDDPDKVLPLQDDSRRLRL